MFRKLSLFLLILALIPGFAFSQGAKEIQEGEEIVKVLSVSQGSDAWMIHVQSQDGTDKIYLAGDETEIMGIPVEQLSEGDFIAVKGTGISTMSLPPQLPALSIRYMTPLVATGAVEVSFAPLRHPGLVIQVAEVNTEDLRSAFSYSYGFLSMEALKSNDVYPNGGYFARGIIDAGSLDTVQPLIALEEMNTVLSDYIENHIQKGLPVRYGDVVSTKEAIDALTAPVTDDEKFAYAYGYFTMLNLIYSAIPVNAPEFADGLLSSLYGASQLFTAEEMQGYVDDYIAQLEAEYQAHVEELATTNLEKANAFLADNAAKEGVTTLESGVQIEYVNDDQTSDAVPTAESSVVVDYTLTDIDGNVMDQGTDVEFNLQSLIPGFAEAVQHMTPGDSIKAYIPPALGYGEAWAGTIQPNSLLIFDITLNQIL